MIFIRYRHLLILFFAVILAVLSLFCAKKEENTQETWGQIPQKTYIIDAGHGGEDGGAVGCDKTVESTINLSVARKLDGLLCFLGYSCVMTRTEDKATYSDGCTTIREKKVSDIKNRVALVNKTPNGVLISIHQNMLPAHPEVFGAQVFYAPSEESRLLASALQSQLNQTINGTNTKQEKCTDGSIYLLENIENTGVLVECGFLSNSEETQKLKTDAYQKLLAITIASGIHKGESTIP